LDDADVIPRYGVAAYGGRDLEIPPADGESNAAYRAALAEPPISPHLAGWCGIPFG